LRHLMELKRSNRGALQQPGIAGIGRASRMLSHSLASGSAPKFAL